ncbi:MAG: hypothetical protein JW991_03990 [Candidatus Pacebacteria bacterium]|nr:hypothetical protein [Candidatus Paceibacterota bacterium]
MKKILRTSWRYIRRSPYQALAAIGIMSLTLYAAAVFVLIAAGSEKILVHFEARPQVVAFLKDEMERSQIDSLVLKLKASSKISSVVYVSKEEALEIYREQNKNDPLLLEMVSAEILPASLEVATKEIFQLEEIAGLLRKEPGVEEVSFQEDVVQVLQKAITNIRTGGIVLISFLVLVSFSVVLMVIGMKASSRRREVKIMKLVGATSGYIRAPFLLEGIFYGVTSAFLAWGAAYTSLLYATPFLINFLSGIALLPVSVVFMLLVLAGLLLGGVIIGTLGSLIAVRRYLRL